MKADVIAQVVEKACPSIGPWPEEGKYSRSVWRTKFAYGLGNWFLQLGSLGSTDGQEDMPIFEQGLDALLWQRLGGHLRNIYMEHCLPECTKSDHDCLYRKCLTDPSWCFRKTLAYSRLVTSLHGDISHYMHQRLGAHYYEKCSTCNLSRAQQILADAHERGVYLDRLPINSDNSGCRSLQPFEEANILTALLNIVGALGYQLHDVYIFGTATGRYGYSPRRPSVGDHVCVVPGGKLLHIISADKSRYIGAASVGGLMGDEILEQELFPDPAGRFEEVVLF